MRITPRGSMIMPLPLVPATGLRVSALQRILMSAARVSRLSVLKENGSGAGAGGAGDGGGGIGFAVISLFSVLSEGFSTVLPVDMTAVDKGGVAEAVVSSFAEEKSGGSGGEVYKMAFISKAMPKRRAQTINPASGRCIEAIIPREFLKRRRCSFHLRSSFFKVESECTSKAGLV